MFNISIITKYFNKIKNYSVEKNNIYSKISKSPQIEFDKNSKELFDKKFNEYINIFISFMNKNPNIDLKLFYENLKTLIIKEKRTFNKLFFIKSYTRGHYDAYENKILIKNDDNFYTIYHELLHCASRRIIKNEMNAGFHKFVVDEKNNKIIFNMGKSLTEGYTTLLEKRYFDSIEHTQKRGYIIEEFISENLEKIVGQERMEYLYFNADLDGLINYLKQFSSEEDIYTFLKYFDKILVTSKKKVTPKEAKYIYRFIAEFLLKAYTLKLLNLYKNNIITREDFINDFDKFVINLSTNTVYNKKKTYYFLTRDLTDRILDEIYNNMEDEKSMLSKIK